LYLAVALEREA
jgi:hypothetical protein